MLKINNHACFWLGFFGVLLTLSGLVVTATVFIYASARQDADVLAFCRVALIVGPLMIGQAIIANHRVTIDEAFQFGRDIGEESGYKKGRQTQRPVVVDHKHADGETPARRRTE